MTRQLIEADFILCVVTETYARRFSDDELADVGLGVGWEAGLIRRLLYAKKLRRIFPVFFTDLDRRQIPLELQGYDFVLLDGNAGYETLLRKLVNRPLHAGHGVGTPPDLQTQTTTPLFARPGSDASPRSNFHADISRIIKYAPEELIGREAETRLRPPPRRRATPYPSRPHRLRLAAVSRRPSH